MRKIMGEVKEVRQVEVSEDGGMICQECGNRGYHRFDNGLASGVHCDECWSRLVQESHSKSW